MSNCPKSKADCKNSDLVQSFNELLDQLEDKDTKDLIPITQKEVRIMRQALKKYLKECKYCASATGNNYKCLNSAAKNLKRRSPLFNKDVYPWLNYDWNYSNYVSNNYLPRHTGATKRSNIQAMYDNIIALSKVLDGLIADPNPGIRSRAGIKNRYSDYPPLHECNTPRCIATQNVKNALNNQIGNPPTSDNFLKQKKLTGKYSSSYYIKIGTCDRQDIQSEKKCEEKGYKWSPDVISNVISKLKKNKSDVKKEGPKKGKCLQPRYMFIDNSSKPILNGSKMEGMIPSLGNTIRDIMPDKILSVALGNSLNDTFEIQQCPNTSENFVNYTKYKYESILTVLLLLLLIYFLNINK